MTRSQKTTEAIYGVSLLAEATYVSTLHEGRPVLMGKRFRHDNAIVDLSLNVPAAGPCEEQIASIRLELSWAYGIIKKTFPQENIFQCVISYPGWMGYGWISRLESLAKDCGLLPVRLGHNLRLAGLYANYITKNIQTQHWMLVLFDHREISVLVQETEDGIIEALATKCFLSENAPLIPSCMDSLERIMTEACRESQVTSSQITHCLVASSSETSFQCIAQKVGAFLQRPSDSILCDSSAISLGTALEAGIMSGQIRDTLPLWGCVGRILFSIDSSDQIRLNHAADEPGLELNQTYPFISSHTTVPTLKGEDCSMTLPAAGKVRLRIYEDIDLAYGSMGATEIGATEITNLSSADVDATVTFLIGIDAFPRPTLKVEVRSNKDQSILLTGGYLLSSPDSYSAAVVRDLGDQTDTSPADRPPPHIPGSDAELQNYLLQLRSQRSLHTKDILDRVITAEKKRISKRKKAFGLVTGSIALALGLDNGLDIADLTLAFGGYKAGQQIHGFASKEKIEFLGKIQSSWMIADRSPLDIRRRLGDPIARFVGVKEDGMLFVSNVHQSVARGSHLVELLPASLVCEGFTRPESREVLERVFSPPELQCFAEQLYPFSVTPLSLFRVIQQAEAETKDPWYDFLKDVGAPFRLLLPDSRDQIVYKIPIPDHSDF